MARQSLKNVCRLLEETKRELPVEKSFLEDLKRSIELEANKNNRLPSKTYKPSGMNCIRASYYQITGHEPDKGDTNYTLVGICNSGTDIHERVQKSVANMINVGIDCVYIDVKDFVKQRNLTDLNIVSQNGMETKLYHNKLNMSFMCDGIIKYKNHYYILELKTENSYKFMNRKDVDPSHFNQGIAYSLAFGIDEVIFIYISRDILDMKSFLFEVTPEMKEQLVGYIEECDSYVKNLVAPPKPKDVAKKTCNYCMYKTQCRKDG